MRHPQLLKNRLALLFLAALPQPAVRAGEFPLSLEMTVGQGKILDFSSEVTRVYTSNPEVADVVVIDAHEIVVNAKGAGKATMAVWLQPGGSGGPVRTDSLAVTVTLDLVPIQKLLDQAFPDDRMTVSGNKDALVLLGRARKANIVERALALLKPFAQAVASGVEVVPPEGEKQVALHVIFAELDRTASEAFGVNLLSTGAANTPGEISTGQYSPPLSQQVSGTIGKAVTGTQTTFGTPNLLNIFAFRPDLNLGATIQALQAKGVLQILAQPDLVTTDGKEAHFTVGGEFPVPVPQTGAAAGAITVQFREFGIRLSFTPNTTPNGTLKLHVQPEVSTLDSANGIVLSGFNIPALSTRKVETEVELSAGQSFAIAGLLDDRVTENLSKVPGIGDIPVLGSLFRSRSRSRSKTELIVVVTPEIRTPLGAGTAAPLPEMPVPFLPRPDRPKQ